MGGNEKQVEGQGTVGRQLCRDGASQFLTHPGNDDTDLPARLHQP